LRSLVHGIDTANRPKPDVARLQHTR